jgi:DNA-binding response OmpR family regulator
MKAVMAKVMLIEDDENMLDLLSMFLQIEGFRVTQLKPGANLLENIRKERPDLVFMDVHLKGAKGEEISGLDLVKQIRQDEFTRSTRVMMASGMDVSSECRNAGADDFLLKPFMPDELIGKIKKFVRN